MRAIAGVAVAIGLAVPVSAQTLAGGAAHTLILRSDGTVWAVGLNNTGQLGDGSTTSRGTPVQVSGLSDVVAIAAGAFHSMAITSTGGLYAWGGNSSGQLGDSSTTPSHVARAIGADQRRGDRRR